MLYEKRDTARALTCLAGRLAALGAALVLPVAGPVAPAHAAATVCTVNGVAQPGPDIVGTNDADTIECSSVEAGHTVEALGGVDIITLTGPVDGNVRGGDGVDQITLTGGSAAVNGTGAVDGQAGDDVITIRSLVLGAVRGGQGDDDIRFADGSRMAARTDVRGARGADTITFEEGVDVSGLVEANEADDTIDVHGTVTSTGRVRGGDGDDSVHVHNNQGVVDARSGARDVCVVDMGTPCAR
ncbi:hypothetical protein [Streptomyces sp. ISL-11]|uniref:hypothetical protein n=1 Tax=Streptomyces sp. ISL-11 TaxID=2819174 RepID=UPI001BEAD0D1|nr:hypothetical protein [Streptomyces sp. ISL-11]MBT2387116.1 hypothetical protein [Streptomyces sp. ISL-11]